MPELVRRITVCSSPHDPATTPDDVLLWAEARTTSPAGRRMRVDHRLGEIRARYGPDHVVTRALARSAPELTAAVSRITRKLARSTPAPQSASATPATSVVAF